MSDGIRTLDRPACTLSLRYMYTPLMSRIYVQRVDVSDCGLLEKYLCYVVRLFSRQSCLLLHVVSFDVAFTNGGLILD
jgi:hypothetical protein